MNKTDMMASPDKKPPRGNKPKVIDSAELFDHHTVVTILHRGEHYTLRLTASNKLILTK